MTGGNSWGVVNSLLKGHVMPAFTFEKISPPTVREPSPMAPSMAPSMAASMAVAKKPRRLFGHMIDRFVEARIRKSLRKERGQSPRQPK
jgi:hypothetical protein